MSTASDVRAEYLNHQDWIDSDHHSKRFAKNGNLWRLIWVLIVPPEGQRILPTAAGYVLILISLGLGSAAYNTSSNILFMALSLMLSSLILSGFLSWLNFKETAWRLRLPPHFRVGEEAQMWIDLTNKKNMLPTYSLWFNASVKHAAVNKRIFLEEKLEAGKIIELRWAFRPSTRGIEELNVSGIESQFPFGFLKKTVGGGIKREVIVLPERIEYTFNPPGGFRSNHQGETTDRPGGHAELLNIRKYEPGDSQRLVHWKASARLQTLMVKQMADESRDGYTLFIETPGSIWQDPKQFETLCSFVASLAEDLFRDGRLVGAAINDQPVALIKRLPDLHQFLERLGELEPLEHYKPGTEVMSGNIITFKPGALKKVDAYVGINRAGTA